MISGFHIIDQHHKEMRLIITMKALRYLQIQAEMLLYICEIIVMLFVLLDMCSSEFFKIFKLMNSSQIDNV